MKRSSGRTSPLARGVEDVGRDQGRRAAPRARAAPRSQPGSPGIVAGVGCRNAEAVSTSDRVLRQDGRGHGERDEPDRDQHASEQKHRPQAEEADRAVPPRSDNGGEREDDDEERATIRRAATQSWPAAATTAMTRPTHGSVDPCRTMPSVKPATAPPSAARVGVMDFGGAFIGRFL